MIPVNGTRIVCDFLVIVHVSYMHDFFGFIEGSCRKPKYGLYEITHYPCRKSKKTRQISVNISIKLNETVQIRVHTEKTLIFSYSARKSRTWRSLKFPSCLFYSQKDVWHPHNQRRKKGPGGIDYPREELSTEPDLAILIKTKCIFYSNFTQLFALMF